MSDQPNCAELVEQLTELMEGTLDSVAEQRIRHHLAECAGCHGYFAQIQATVELLRRLGSARSGLATRPPAST
jgi:predicted anti-sigma-YlaC factor YlaD